MKTQQQRQAEKEYQRVKERQRNYSAKHRTELRRQKSYRQIGK